nr:disease resistance protein RPM1-like [Ipomoea batatas]
MAEAAVEFLLDQLSAVISKECSLLGGIREDAQYIMDALSRLRAALRVADEREEIDPQVNAWVKIVRELAYDTEDVLDEFLFHFGGRHTGGGFFTKMKNKYNSAKNLRTQHRLALALQKIKARISENSQYQPILPTTTVHNHNQQLHGRVGALFQEDSDLVGFENSKQSLIKLLLGAVDDDLRVHSVVGMGGLGKTTLVKKAYDDAQVTMHFQRRVWVTVSETFKIEELLKDVIKKLGNPPNGDSTDELIQSVRDILSEQRYIIVFDDVWSFDVWRDIKYAFTRQKFGSRVVITTRNSEIGRNACHETQGDVYELKHLSEKDSWELFCKKTFLSDSCPPHLVNIAEDIVNKCGGLPLAIVVIAGIMATKGEDIAEWKNFQLKTDDRMKNLENLLSLSYYDLPYYLKYCFLYFSIVPEDAIIKKNRVIKLWIAEGFVKEKDKSHAGKIIGLRVHDILREIILSKALEQNFAVILTRQNKEWSDDKCRRLIIHGFDDDILKSTSSKSHIRSLQLYHDEVLVSFSFSKLLSFDYYIPLKVLDLRGNSLKKIPKEVFKLFHLKYLGLRRTWLRHVSKSIGLLQNLEVLDLKGTWVKNLPIEVEKLDKLRNLIVGWCGFYAHFRIRRLLFLQELRYVQAKKTNGLKVVSEIGNLTQLRKLGVKGLRQEDGKELCSCIEKLTNLISLSLEAAGAKNRGNEILDIQHSLSTVPLCLRTLKLYGRLERIPQWLSSLVSLTKLELWYSCVLEDPLLLLHDLPMLAHLRLYKSYEGEGLCFKAGKFPKLKFLDIALSRALRWIMVEEGAMPNLEELWLHDCRSLEQVPFGIQHLSKLNSIKLVVEIGKLHKLRHLTVGFDFSGFYAPFEIGRLLFLQKLSYVQAKKSNGVKMVSEIGNLTQLRKLGVTDLRQEDGKELCLSMKKLTNLISLSLKVARENENEILDIQHSLSTVPLCLRTLKLNGRLERIPQWLSSLVSLTKLELWNSCVLEDPLLLLQDLPMLAHLHLLQSYEGEGLCFKAGKFPKLKYLDISWLRALKWIMVEEGAMPLLEELSLYECKLLEQLPFGIQHLSKLNSIGFMNMNDSLMLSLEPNGENYSKISHIPHIQIYK